MVSRIASSTRKCWQTILYIQLYQGDDMFHVKTWSRIPYDRPTRSILKPDLRMVSQGDLSTPNSNHLEIVFRSQPSPASCTACTCHQSLLLSCSLPQQHHFPKLAVSRTTLGGKVGGDHAHTSPGHGWLIQALATHFSPDDKWHNSTT